MATHNEAAAKNATEAGKLYQDSLQKAEQEAMQKASKAQNLQPKNAHKNWNGLT